MTFPPDPPVQVEVPVLSLRRHGRHLTLPVLFLVALAAASGFWVGTLPEPWLNWAAGLGAAVLGLLLGIGPILGWLATRTTITNRRVIQRSGFLVHHRTEVPLSRVRGVRSTRGPVQRMFGSGDVELLVGAEEPTILSDVPGCAAVVDALQELIERDFAVQSATGSHGAPQSPPPHGQAPHRGGDTAVLPGL